MEYEFFRSVEGRHSAQFAMGHEIMGPWLSDEIDKAEAEHLLVLIAEVAKGDLPEVKRQYSDSMLLLNRDEAELTAHALAFEHHDLQEGMVYYDDEQQAGCGLEDLVYMLRQWYDFVSE